MAESIIHWHPGLHCCNPRWEEAYNRFETPAEEIAKFTKRLLRLGVDRWPRDMRFLDLFCGHGSGLKALEGMGFTHLSGVDLSPHLLAQYQGPARLYVADARHLRFEDHSLDAVMVQGGLHHLPALPGDLDQVLDEVRRVLKPGGRFLVVEPWWTPFLFFVHGMSYTPLRSAWGKLDALAVMTEEESGTYYRWLGESRTVLESLHARFEPEIERMAWGKLNFVGRPR